MAAPVVGDDPEVLGATVAYSYPGIDGWSLPYATRETDLTGRGLLPEANYAGVMDDFAESLRDEVDAGSVVEGWVEVVEETMQPSTVGVWVRP